jgi:hypothetical protein
MKKKLKPKRTLQHGLFEDLPEKEAREQSADRREKWEKYLASLHRSTGTEGTRVSIIRGFIALYMKDVPNNIVTLPLESLGGKTLTELAKDNWPMVHAWMTEVRMYPGEKENFIRLRTQTETSK